MSRQARSLDVLLDEVNRAAPKRSKASDGGMGDPAHAARVSDHNPNAAGVWRARDFTHDPAGGLDCTRLAAFLVARLGKHPALASGAYIIWRSRIISTDRLAEGWRPYSGSNPHDKHLHLSVASAFRGYDNVTPWGWPASQVRFVTANLDKERGGDRAYLRHLRGLVEGRGLLSVQERGTGLSSVRFRALGMKRVPLPLWVVGRVGAHRAVARTWVKVDGARVRVFNIHGLHKRTVGQKAHDAHLDAIAKKLHSLTAAGKPWVATGDFNDSVTYVASRFGGAGHGKGIVGFVVSPGLRVTAEGADDHGLRRGYTDHPAYWIDLAKEKP